MGASAGDGAGQDGALALEQTHQAPPAARPDLEALQEVDADLFALGVELARGGMGRISAARDRRLKRDIAIKQVLSDEESLLERFHLEALITARLQHPGIVPVYEAGRLAGVPFYAMKLLRGRPFDQVIRDTRTVAERLALLPHLVAIADALAYAHGQRIIHRDLKPANVLVAEYGETVVIDWGLAKDLSQPGSDALPGFTITSTGMDDSSRGAVMGTPAYMPPEQAAGEIVDERADVYALGAIMYHTLSGVPPYRGRTISDLLAGVLAGPPRPLEDVQAGIPSDLLAVVRKAMARAPQQRYATARELAHDLRRFQTGQLVAAHHYSASELLYRWVRRHRTAVAVAAAALLVLLAAGAWAVRVVVKERDAAVAQERAARIARAERDVSARELSQARVEKAALEEEIARVRDRQAELARTKIASADGDAAKLGAEEQALAEKQTALDARLQEVLDRYGELATGAGVPAVAQRESFIADREKGVAVREDMVARREQALAERERALAERERAMGQGTTVIMQAPARP